MKKYKYYNIIKLKNFLQKEEIKECIENNNFSLLFSRAFNTLITHPIKEKVYIKLISDLIYLFLNTQDNYIPDYWTIVKFDTDEWLFIDNNYKGERTINGAVTYSSLKEAEKKAELFNQIVSATNPQSGIVYKVLGLKGEL